MGPLGISWAEFGGVKPEAPGYGVFSLVEAAAGPASSVSNTRSSPACAPSPASSSGSPGPPRRPRFGSSRKSSAGSCAASERAPPGCWLWDRRVAREAQHLLPEVPHADREIAALAPSPPASLARRVQRRQRVVVDDARRAPARITCSSETIRKQIKDLWDKLPIFRDSMDEVPTIHVPNKKA